MVRVVTRAAALAMVVRFTGLPSWIASNGLDRPGAGSPAVSVGHSRRRSRRDRDRLT